MSALDIRSRVLRELHSLDARLRAEVGELRSLAPSRSYASSLRDLAEAVVPTDAPAPRVKAFGRCLHGAASAQLRHFPRTLFWDFDYLAASLWDDAGNSDAPATYLRNAQTSLERLYALFGEAGPIRFRYAHDFVYGFDWAKWVKRRRRERAGIGPFHLAFLEYVVERGEQLLALIETDDATYPRLHDARFRNPFRFARSPEQELALYRDLAAHDLVPVKGWQRDERAHWDRPYEQLRMARARALGIAGASSDA